MRAGIRTAVRAFYVAVSPLAAILLACAPASVQADTAPGTCMPVSLQVALAAGKTADQTINGTLCNPLAWAAGPHRVDVLVHGATYDNTYWNWPLDTGQYSYVNQTLQAGRATFAYDMLGAGTSSKPLGITITVDTEAFVLHQVLNYVRSLSAYSKFDVVGHSFGSTLSIDEAATYHDVDALVLTAYSHALNPVHAVEATADFHPVTLDAQFEGSGLDASYLTTVSGVRQGLFYGTSADPAIVAYDEEHKDATPGAAFATGLTQIQEPALINISNHITAPVFEVLGQEDFLVCGTGALVNCASPGSVQAFDAPYFTHAASFSVQTIPLTGHDLALHPTNGQSFAAINGWLQTH